MCSYILRMMCKVQCPPEQTGQDDSDNNYYYNNAADDDAMTTTTTIIIIIQFICIAPELILLLSGASHKCTNVEVSV